MSDKTIQELALSRLDSVDESYLRYSVEELRDKKDLVIAEIGVENGDNALRLLKNLDIKRIYLVDWYKPSPQYGYTEEMVESQRKHAYEVLEPWKDKIIWIEKDSVEASENVKEELDYVYIDGDHTDNGVYRDIVAWYPRVKKGGICGGHDFMCFAECRNGVMRYLLENNLTASIHFQDWKINK
jgi:hypothetical protein